MARRILANQSSDGGSGGGSGGPYVDDLFSTYVYEGNGGTQTIENGIDLAGEGGLVWGKSRDHVQNNIFYDTERGIGKVLISNSSGLNNIDEAGKGLTAFNDNGFSLGPDWAGGTNFDGGAMVAWTWRKAPNFSTV